jgi:hypothetical protein
VASVRGAKGLPLSPPPPLIMLKVITEIKKGGKLHSNGVHTLSLHYSIMMIIYFRHKLIYFFSFHLAVEMSSNSKQLRATWRSNSAYDT